MKILLTADLHINSPARAELLRRIFSLAAERGSEAVLIAGDLLESPFPDEETGRAVLEILSAPGCPVYLAAGNHDPAGMTALYRRLPERVVLFPAEITAVQLRDGWTLWGYSFVSGPGEDRPLEGFFAPREGLHLLLAHAHFDAPGGFRPVMGTDLKASGFRFAVLGHIHKPSLTQSGYCTVLTPGTPEGRGWDEHGERWVYEMDERGALEKINIARQSWWKPETDLTGCVTEAEIITRLEQIKVPAGGRVRLTLTGLPHCSAAECAERWRQKTGWEVLDQTLPTEPLDVLREQNTLQGAFVRCALEEIEAAAPERKPVLQRALQLGLKAMREARL